ncbi:hypothetical protein COCNU_05G004410 [Cocos nucifera]|uniref:PHD-type domain-containing protein n=1 Tax=Cocos nucifera TaxID=13894 RepID=A0A8K0I815_COCNU|nr:hypothetical protein COCNU_05G004410 [Cocos nucifera]
MQRQAVVASLAAEDYVRRLEAGGAACIIEGNGASFVGLESDHANWTAKVCRRTGDPNKLMFCKRCDGAYHCYCQQPPHKNVSHGPYLCPKHTRCHSCGSTVPGSGLSTRWFLGYTCCDACGRLFVKGNYCPVCLKQKEDFKMHRKLDLDHDLISAGLLIHLAVGSSSLVSGLVYAIENQVVDDLMEKLASIVKLIRRQPLIQGDTSENPKVPLDILQDNFNFAIFMPVLDSTTWKWFCMRMGLNTYLKAFQNLLMTISGDEKYQQFQADQNLYYKCAACRGDCYQVKDVDDAVRELWRRRDMVDCDQIATLRAAAGLPSQEEIFSVSPYSDDEQAGPIILKDDSGRTLKFSVKGISDKPLKNFKEHGKSISKNSALNKKYVKKKGYQLNLVGKAEETYQNIERQNEARSFDNTFRDQKIDDMNALRTNNSFTNEVVVHDADTAPKVKIKDGKLQSLHFKECSIKNVSKSECVRGSEDSSQRRTKDSGNHMQDDHGGTVRSDGDKLDNSCFTRSPKHGVKEKNVIKLGKVYARQGKSNSGIGEACELTTACRSHLVVGKRSTEVGPAAETLAQRNDVVLQKNQPADTPVKSFTHPKPLLKLKFKKSYIEQQSSWAPQGEEVNSVKGQRSKRKRPSADKVSAEDDENYPQLQQENPMDGAMDANWILQKLGKDAIGKRVEVHQSSDNSWHQGVVSDINQGTSAVSVCLDDGRSKTLLLGKQGIRFISQKQKRTKT